MTPHRADITVKTVAANERIRFVRRVTARHGEIFRAVMRNLWTNFGGCAGDLSYALEQTRIMEWPDRDAAGDETPAQVRHQALELEIFERMFVLAEDAIVSAFVSVAAEVVERERNKQARRQRAKK